MFATIMALLADAPAIIDDAGKVIEGTEEAIADAKKLAASPDVIAFEAALSKLFTSTTTPGAAAVIEPVTSAPADGMKR
jgi:hypothetical protein